MTDKPVWRQGYAVVERYVAPRVEALVRTGEFAHTTATFARARWLVRDLVTGGRCVTTFAIVTASYPTCSCSRTSSTALGQE
jgi:hypothetical protein